MIYKCAIRHHNTSIIKVPKCVFSVYNAGPIFAPLPRVLAPDEAVSMKRAAGRARRRSAPAASVARRVRPAAAARDTVARPASGEAIAIRPVRATDIPQVIALDEQITGIAKPEHWHGLYQRYHSQRGRDQVFLVAAAADAGAAGPILGFIVGEIRAWEFGSAPCGWVYALSVRPDARLRGLGETLLEQLCSEFRHLGVTKMRTMAARDNLLTMQFFRAAGMTAGPYIELEKDLG